LLTTTKYQIRLLKVAGGDFASAVVAGLLQLLLGTFGLGRFYIGDTTVGGIQLCAGVAGLFLTFFCFMTPVRGLGPPRSLLGAGRVFSDRSAPQTVSGSASLPERPCLFVSVAGFAQLLNAGIRAELRQQFKDSAGNIAGENYQRFTSVHLAREEKRGSSQLRRLVVE
jgi:TM2 domain-containing membrane protein YozV